MKGYIVAGKNNGGSRTDSVSGAGYIITTDNNNNTLEKRSFKLPDYCTKVQRELIAIIESCKFLSTHTNTNIIILWSDSLSSIQATSSLSTKNRTTIETVMTLINDKVVRLINKSEYLVILLTDGPGHTKLAETRSLTH